MGNIRRGETIEFDYTNWKGETSKRTVFVNEFYYGSNEFHPEEQWLMDAWDQEKLQHRKFAMADMTNVKITKNLASRRLQK